jgi:hypothetical protein
MAAQKKPNLKGGAGTGQGASMDSQANNPQPMTDPAPSQNMAGTGKRQGSGMMKYAIIGIAAVVVIVIAALLLSGGGAPSQLTSALSQKTLNATMLSKVISQKVNATPEFTVNYSGEAVINITSALSGSESMTLPVIYKFQKYNNDSRTDIAIQDVPFLGSLAVSSFHINGKNYTCMQGGGAFGGGGAGGITCTQIQQQQQTSAAFNTSGLSKALTMSVNSTGQESFKGQACSKASGAIKYTQPQLVSGFSQQSQSESLNGTFNACFSNEYFVPLTVSAHFAGANYSVTFHMNETAISATASKSYVTVLPGPVENTSYGGSASVGTGSGGYGGSGSYGNGSTGNGYGGNGGTILGTSCIATAGLLCNGPIMMQNGTFDAIIGQNTGETMQYVEMACTTSTSAQPQGNPYESIDSNGTAWTTGLYNTDLVSGGEVFLSGLQCVDSYGNPLRNLAIGTSETGMLWMRVAANYTDAETNNFNTPQEFGTFTVKVS